MSYEHENKEYLETKIGVFHKDASISTIYIGNLDYTKDEYDIKDLFEAHGYVNYVKIIKDNQTHESKGIAFVQMNNRKHAKYAISQLNGSEVFGRKLKVNIAVDTNEDRPAVQKGRRKAYKAYVSKADRAALETVSTSVTVAE